MYSDDEFTGSCHSSCSTELLRMGQEQARTNQPADARDSGCSDGTPVIASSDENEEANNGCDNEQGSSYHGPVGLTEVPTSCLERCAIFFDAALFDPRSGPGGSNECVVECSMKVAKYPFCQPTALPTTTLLYTPVVSAANMTKNARAITAQRWGQLMATQHGIPCEPKGTGTQYEELQKTARTYRTLIYSYCHTLREVKNTSSNNNSCSSTSNTPNAEMSVALTDDELHDKLPGIFWNTVNAALDACQTTRAPLEVAFLTTESRSEEVGRSLLWLQKKKSGSRSPSLQSLHRCVGARR
jgi:hypothetical protein